MTLNRRHFLASAAAVPLAAKNLPALPVAVARAASYQEDLPAILGTMFDQLGGLAPKVKDKTVTVKLNLTGSPALKFQGKSPSVTHYSHHRLAFALAHVLDRAGARRIRFVESCWASAGPLEEYMLDSGWNVRQLQSVSPRIEFENTNALGRGKRYARFKVPGGGLVFPSYELNQAYDETDVLVSLAKLKEHATCGVTLSMKNIFGITPASIYGDDAGLDAPNESPTKGRVKVCHLGERQPAAIAARELAPASSRDPGFRMPRITAELNAARPIDIALIDGIESISGGEGPWIKGIALTRPGVLLAGFNPVNTDAVGTAIMGLDPRAAMGTPPFDKCANTFLLAEQLGLGTADLARIPVLGTPVDAVRYPYRK